jgi:uncharacterized protein YbaR (Trm112 family)
MELLFWEDMIDSELLALLVCPETHQDVALVPEGQIARLNAAIQAGQLLTVTGKKVDEAIEGALIRTDGAVAYPIRDGIPVMLVPEGLAIRGLSLGDEAKAGVHG